MHAWCIIECVVCWRKLRRIYCFCTITISINKLLHTCKWSILRALISFCLYYMCHVWRCFWRLNLILGRGGCKYNLVEDVLLNYLSLAVEDCNSYTSSLFPKEQFIWKFPNNHDVELVSWSWMMMNNIGIL